MREREEDVRDEPGLFPHFEHPRADVIGQVFELRPGIAADRGRGHGRGDSKSDRGNEVAVVIPRRDRLSIRRRHRVPGHRSSERRASGTAEPLRRGFSPPAVCYIRPMLPALPTGAVTFLFSDIEGSTSLWEQAPEAMRSLLAWHDRVVRSAIESSGGYVVKTTGDGVYAVFADAKNAIAACVQAQRTLQAPEADATSTRPPPSDPPTPLRVRMGLHRREAELRDGDYFGAAPNRTARIMSVAHGGQVLLSAATADAAHVDLPGDVSPRDMGEHRLKGLLNPERLVQLVAPGLRTDFPPLASQAGHSLPAERDAFVGRIDRAKLGTSSGICRSFLASVTTRCRTTRRR